MTRKRIGIDIRMAFWSGIGRYIRGLLPHLNLGKFEYLLMGEEEEEILARNFTFSTVHAPVYSLREQALIPYAARRCQCLHVPNFNAPIFWAKKTVVTYHDLIHFHYPEQLNSSLARLYTKTMLPLIAKRSDAIISVSEYTKNDLVTHFGINPKKVTVIHHGINAELLSFENNTIPPPQPYFLYVGLIKFHKNVGLLIEAFKQLRKKMTDWPIQLRLVGTADMKQAIVREWVDTIQKNPQIIWEDHVEDRTLSQLYRNAAALVFPSLFEGFGFPVLEAMALGTPVVAAHATAIPEILGDAGLYFDPKSVSELVKAMEQILTNETLKKDLAKKGLVRSKLFDWSLAAQKTERVYESIL